MAVTKLNFFTKWVPAEYQTDGARRTQASILLAVLIFNNIYCILSLLYVRYGLNALPKDIRQVGFNLIFIAMVTYLSALAFYFRFKKLRVAGHLVVLGLFSSAASGMFVSGGYTESPLPVLVFLAPTFAFLLLGLRAGIFWSAICMGALVLLWLLEQWQIVEPLQLLTQPVIKRNLSLVVPATMGIMVIAAMVIYESITLRLREELDLEKNKFKWDASHDSLTGLPNRPEFYHRLQLGMRNAEVNKQSLALVYVDLDNFKPVNDEMGHHAGDEVLKVVSKRMLSMVRGSDCVARLGGDEFAIILQGVNTQPEVMNVILSKTLKAISEKMIIDGREVAVGASMGVAYYEESDMDLNALCRKADTAMYQAKQQKNRWCLYRNE